MKKLLFKINQKVLPRLFPIIFIVVSILTPCSVNASETFTVAEIERFNNECIAATIESSNEILKQTMDEAIKLAGEIVINYSECSHGSTYTVTNPPEVISGPDAYWCYVTRQFVWTYCSLCGILLNTEAFIHHEYHDFYINLPGYKKCAKCGFDMVYRR